MKKYLYPLFFACVSMLLTLSAAGATRQYAVTQLNRLAETQCGYQSLYTLSAFQKAKTFDDYDQMDYGAAFEFGVAIEKGVINGYEDNTLRPEDEVTRSDFAIMIYRYRDDLPQTEWLCPIDMTAFPEIPDWKVAAVQFCLERGLLEVKEDGTFGADEPITASQIMTAIRRIREGLASLEKYRFLESHGCSSIHLEKILNSADRNVIASESMLEKLINADTPSAFSGRWGAKELSATIEEVLNVDCRKLYSEEKTVSYAVKIAEASTIHDKKLSQIVINGIRFDVQEFTKDIFRKQIKKDSIFVVPDENTYSLGYNSSYTHYAVGYEYFIYYEGSPEALPEGVEFGKWYRRIIYATIDSPKGSSCVFYVSYGACEPIPEDFYNA